MRDRYRARPMDRVSLLCSALLCSALLSSLLASHYMGGFFTPYNHKASPPSLLIDSRVRLSNGSVCKIYCGTAFSPTLSLLACRHLSNQDFVPWSVRIRAAYLDMYEIRCAGLCSWSLLIDPLCDVKTLRQITILVCPWRRCEDMRSDRSWKESAHCLLAF